MKSFIKIGIYLMLLVLLTAEDCGDNYSQSQQAEMLETKIFQELEDEFVSEELDAEHLQVLEKRAIQKLQELFDYLNIYADSSLNVQFRKQARLMAGKAFISEKNLHEFFLKQELLEDSVNYLLLSSAKETVRFDVGLLNIEKSLEYSGSNYTGQLIYQLQKSNAKLGVRAMKTTKLFGNEKLDVWELFFDF